MKQAKKPYGQGIRDLCELLEQNGPLAPKSICALSSKSPTGVRAYLSRAVRYGLVRRGDYAVYSVIIGWRDRLGDDPLKGTRRPKPKYPWRDKPMPANSVFALGSMA
jgi:hypothetical protein